MKNLILTICILSMSMSSFSQEFSQIVSYDRNIKVNQLQKEGDKKLVVDSTSIAHLLFAEVMNGSLDIYTRPDRTRLTLNLESVKSRMFFIDTLWERSDYTDCRTRMVLDTVTIRDTHIEKIRFWEEWVIKETGEIEKTLVGLSPIFEVYKGKTRQELREFYWVKWEDIQAYLNK